MTEISKYIAPASTTAVPEVTYVSISASTGKSLNLQASNSQVITFATVSSLAQQISDAATRAAARDAKIGSSGLAAAATSIVDKLAGQTYQANKAANDAKVPNTDDPTLLARAKQATDSINGKGANPFAGLSRDQLALIAYDESDSFTVNERKAALDEAQNQESQWRQQILAKAMSAYKGGEGANSREAGKQLLDHLKSLSPIEQAQYPQSYAVQFQVMAESGATYSAVSPLDALKFLSQLNKWATTPEVDGLPSVGTADVGVLPKPDLAKFEADASLPRNELMAKYEKAVRSLPSMKSADLPRSNDPDRLAQALKATDYAWGNGPSPFASLTRNEVVAIYYDDSGTYTRDERMAAVKQLNEIDRNLWDGLTTKAANTGDWREVNEMGLKNFDELLPIEKMRYPANYKMQLHLLLAYDNAKAGGALSKEQKKTLLDMLDALNHHQPKTAPESEDRGDVARPWSDSWSAKLADLVRHAIRDTAGGG